MNTTNNKAPGAQDAAGEYSYPLTNEQITAGAAILCDHGKRVGRNVAIMVFDAMNAQREKLPAGAVPVPYTVDMARMMVALGRRYLQENAPEYLPAQQALIALGKYASGYRPGQDGWTAEDEAALQAAMGTARCSCPSGDGDLAWPCPRHGATKGDE